MKQLLLIGGFLLCILLVHFACDAKWHLKPGAYSGTWLGASGMDKIKATIDDKGSISGTVSDDTYTGSITGKVSDSGDFSATVSLNGATSNISGQVRFGQGSLVGEVRESGTAKGKEFINLNRTGDR
jgi:hypothetical protein